MIDGIREVKQGYNVVMLLAYPYFETNKIITADNFFSSIPLVTDLLKKNIYSVSKPLLMIWFPNPLFYFLCLFQFYFMKLILS